MKVTKSLYFEAAHRLMEHKGLCRFIHGHSYRADISVEGPVEKKTGMVVDFKELKSIFGVTIDRFDHSCILNCSDRVWVRYFKRRDQRLIVFAGEPTAENLAREILLSSLPKVLMTWPKIKSLEVAVWETRDSFATYKWSSESSRSVAKVDE